MTREKFNELLKNIKDEDNFRLFHDEFCPLATKFCLYQYGNKEVAKAMSEDFFSTYAQRTCLTYKTPKDGCTPCANSWAKKFGKQPHCKRTGKVVFRLQRRNVGGNHGMPWDN